MSAQDKIERALKQIHILISEGQKVSESVDKVIIDTKKIFDALEQLNLAVYEVMDQYEMTNQSREMARRRSEKKGEELIERVSRQAEDVYAASLIYTEDALNKVWHLIEEAMESSKDIFQKMDAELEKEKRRVKGNQMELREQLQDFKDSNKYMVMIEECNREREKQSKSSSEPEKKIQNEAKHYPMNIKPEIRVNASYFERRGIAVPKDDTIDNISTAEEIKEEATIPAPVVTVDLDAEYFKWKKEGKQEGNSEEASEKETLSQKKERRFLFGKK